MSSPPLFDSLIVSRPSPAARSFRRGVGAALALSLHLALLGSLVLSPLLFVEMVPPPKASNFGTIEIVQPPPQARRGGDGLPTPRVCAGGGVPRNRETTAERRSPVPKSLDPAQPPRAPLDPPLPRDDQEPAAEATTTSTRPPIEGAPAGPGRPDGDGTGATGAPTGCDECIGRGGPGDGGPGDDGEGEGRVYAWDARIDPPVLIPASRALPKYPDLARRAGVQGSVILMIAIDADGTVGEVQVLRSPDERWGFDEAAIEAVKRWRYRQARLNGRPVTVYAQVMIEFTLSR